MRKRHVFYPRIDASQIDGEGGLRLYRRKWGLKRLDVYHPPGEWWSVELHKDGRCYVLLANRPIVGGVRT